MVYKGKPENMDLLEVKDSVSSSIYKEYSCLLT